MTLIGSLQRFGVTVLYADSQETVSGYAKKAVSKIQTFGSGNLFFAVGGAGSAAHVDAICRFLYTELGHTSVSCYREVEDKLRELAHTYFRENIWVRPHDRPELELLFLAQDPPGPALVFHIADGAANWVESDSKSIGIGSYLADYVVAETLPLINTDDEATVVALAVHALTEVQANIDGCGLGSEVYIFRPDGEIDSLWEHEITQISSLTKEVLRIHRLMFGSIFGPSPIPNGMTSRLNEIGIEYRALLRERREQRNKAMRDAGDRNRKLGS